MVQSTKTSFNLPKHSPINQKYGSINQNMVQSINNFNNKKYLNKTINQNLKTTTKQLVINLQSSDKTFIQKTYPKNLSKKLIQKTYPKHLSKKHIQLYIQIHYSDKNHFFHLPKKFNLQNSTKN